MRNEMRLNLKSIPIVKFLNILSPKKIYAKNCWFCLVLTQHISSFATTIFRLLLHIEDYHGFVCHLIDDMTFPFHFFLFLNAFLLKSTNSFSYKEWVHKIHIKPSSLSYYRKKMLQEESVFSLPCIASLAMWARLIPL